MEQRRQCGFVELQPKKEKTVIWARRNTGTFECPVSFINAASSDWLEQFQLWQIAAKPNLLDYPARTAEAIALLENEWREEINDKAK